MGGANYHTRIRFTDGSVWLVRVPRVNGSIPQSLIDYLVQSEYATLKFLETTNVPAPRAFDYGVVGENNGVGVSYILMEQMPGKPWNMQGPRGKRFADDKDKERIWNGLAEILTELQRYPFHVLGHSFLDFRLQNRKCLPLLASGSSFSVLLGPSILPGIIMRDSSSRICV